jgi:hypothetical protein
MRVVNVVPEAGTLGISGARLVKPRDPNGSILLERMKRRDLHQMPPLATSVVDEDAVKLVRDWIQSLP